MALTTRLNSTLHPVAGLAATLILLGLLAGGANAPVRAALFSGALLMATLTIVAFSPNALIRRVLASHWMSAAAALLFIAFALISTIPLTASALAAQFGHPAARAFDWRAPSISIAPDSTIEGIITFLAPMAAFALGAIARALGPRARIGAWLCVLTIAFAIYAFGRFATGVSVSGARLDAGLGSANAAAAIFGTLALFALACGVERATSPQVENLPARVRWLMFPALAPLATAAFGLAIVCAVLTASRGGLAATAIGFASFIGLLALRTRGANRLLWLAPVLGLAAVGVWVATLHADFIVERFSDTGEALRGRQDILAPHWQAFLARPILGNGLNTFHELNAMAATPENWGSIRFIGAAHNIYVQALEETGLIGFALFALMLGPPLWRALSLASFGSRAPHWSAALYGAGMLLLVHGIMDFALQIPAIAALFAFCLGAFSTPSRDAERSGR